MRSVPARLTSRRSLVLAIAAVGLGALAIATAGAYYGALAAAREPVAESVETAPDRRTHAEYADSLRGEAAGVQGAAWLAAAARALEKTVLIDPPYVERGLLPADPPDALGYRIALHAGERLRLELQARGVADGSPLLDLFAAAGDAVGLLYARAAAGVVEHEAVADGDVIVRLQAPPDRSAGYTLTIARTAALTFPVEGAGIGAVVGHFFDARDGGARRHRAVDILAPSGTPVVAAADGTVDRVEQTEVGGRVVWLNEHGSGRVHYYAHLDRQLVEPGERVRAGDRIGTVGNTGNAADGPPHLHFAIYRDGIGINPLTFLSTREVVDVADHGDADRPSELARIHPVQPRDRVRTKVAGSALRARNSAAGPVSVLERHADLEVLAVAGRLLRVRNRDGREGFVARWLVEPLP